MGFGDRVKHCRKQCLRRLERCGGRLREVTCNPDYWYAYCSTVFSQWVTQRVVVSYCILETCVCLALLVPVKVIPEVLTGGRIMPRTSITPTIATIHLVIRAGSGVLGTFAAMFRKVGRTKFYFGLLLTNLLLSTAVIEPLFACKCSCKGKNENDQRTCESLAHFQNWAWWFAKAERDRARGRRLVDVDGGNAFSWDEPLVQLYRPVTDEEVQRIESFQVLPLGLQYEAPSTYWNCTEHGLEPAKEKVHQIRQKQFELDRLAKGPDERFEKEQLPGDDDELALLRDILDLCAEDQQCQLVELKVNVTTDPVGSDNITEGSLRVCRWWSGNRTYPSILKVLPGCVCKDRCPEDGCSMLPPEAIQDKCKDSCIATQTFIQPDRYWAKPTQGGQAVGELASFFCRTTIFTMLVVLIGLDTLGVCMVFVVYAFMQNRCGDVFLSEDEWVVRESSSYTTNNEPWEDDDDFQAVDISRLPSGRNDQDNRNSATSSRPQADRSMLGSIMGHFGSDASSNVELQRM